MEKDYLFKVKVIEDDDYFPKGSCVCITREEEKEYYGLWTFRGAVISVTIAKEKCIKLDSL